MRCFFCNAEIEQGAQFCPYCGKDLSKFNKCIKCGELLDGGTVFCPNCGTKQLHQDISGKTKSHKWRWILLAILLIGLIVCGVLFLTNGSNTTNNEFLFLSDCPEETNGLSATFEESEDVLKISIYKDGKLLQIIENEPIYTQSICFVDANFDGDLDIYLGSGMDRDVNTLYLWNSNNNKFGEVNSGPYLSSPIFSPLEKAIYTNGTDGENEIWNRKSMWVNGDLVETEKMIEIRDLDKYNKNADEKLNHKYTIFNSYNGIIAEADNITDLPISWKNLFEAINKRNGSDNNQ